MTEPMTPLTEAPDPAQKPQERPQARDSDYQPPPRPTAAQGDADGQDADGQDDDGQGDDGQGDERPGRREARYRRERNEARAQVKALEQRVENLVAGEVARIASDTLEDGGTSCCSTRTSVSCWTTAASLTRRRLPTAPGSLWSGSPAWRGGLG